VRIEDDILVMDSGGKNLSDAAPRSIEAIELLMKR
jgi:Xaa-Pro aminopeptidase